jgi:hypothetical protein
MSASLVAQVVATRVFTIQASHAAAQRWSLGADQEMEVVGQQAERQASPGELLVNVAHESQEDVPIDVIAKDRLSVVPPCRDVMDSAGKLSARRTWHAR